MSSTHQPLLHLNTSHNTKPHCKILLFAISIFALAISALLLLLLLLFLLLLHNDLIISNNDDYLSSSSPSYICRRALNPDDCQNFASQVVTGGAKPPDPVVLLRKLLIKQAHQMNKAMLHTNNLNSQKEGGPLTDCLNLLDQSTDLVLDSIKATENKLTCTSRADVQAWLGGVLTNHVTCLDGLNSLGRESIGQVLEDLISRASASLAVVAALSEHESSDNEMIQPLPSWVAAADRKLLESTGDAIKADIVVAKDGSGNYTTVKVAIAAAPEKSKNRYVIYIKKGRYEENVEVGKKKKNLMIVGDGMDVTIITGSLSVADGSTTFNSATFAAVGEGVILQDLRIENTAGPEKHQAVALRVGADKSVINRCRMDGYQDTLYTHSLRQFYRDSHITGTVDFIFGNAAVVFQKCKVEARKPMKSQKNMVTAQGRTDPNQNTGTSIQDCEITASSELEAAKSSFPTYLGRPWKEYSRTVVMQSYIGDHVDPAGWAEWSGGFALETLYYGEYMNRGPGAGTSKRVGWKGYHVITSAAEAMKFTVKGLIQGGDWIGSTGVAFTEGL